MNTHAFLVAARHSFRNSYHYWRLALVLLLVYQSLWTSTLPVAAVPSRQDVEVTLDTPFDLTIAEEALLTDGEEPLYLWFGAILRDTRCRVGETCDAPGVAEFQLFVSHDDRKDNEMLEIGTDVNERIVQYRGYEIELIEVDPTALNPGDNFILIEYRLTLVVRVAEEVEEAEVESNSTEEQTQAENIQQPPNGLAPIIVDRCHNFSPYDAAAILQEPVNADEPVGNVIFGPLLDAGGAEGFRGFCGYTNLVPASEGESNLEQTHIATQLGYNHVVVADHLSGALLNSSSTGNMITDWFDLALLAEALSAGGENPAGSTFEYLYNAINIGDTASLIDVLYQNAKSNPSFKVAKIPISNATQRDQMLWLWQTLDDGYFSLLISRAGSGFDLVAARLGSDANEKNVRGYSQVLLNKLAEPEASGHCDVLALEDVRAIVGEKVEAHPVANEEGEGCKYTPISDRVTVDSADFSRYFPYAGLLAGVLYPSAAQSQFSTWIQELSTTGRVTDGDALGELLNAIQAGELADALAMMGEIEWNSYQWQVEMLEDDSLLIYDIARTGLAPFFMFQARADGGLTYLAGTQDQEIDEVREALIEAMQKQAEAAAGAK